jgi:uncharacterized membrane protein YfcA
MINIAYVAIGVVMGLFSGLLGIGGGLVLIPILIYFLHLTQHQAQGVSLMVLAVPVTIFAAARYYHAGGIRIGMAALIAVGFIAGSLMGAEAAFRIPDTMLRRLFGAVLFIASVKMMLSR